MHLWLAIAAVWPPAPPVDATPVTPLPQIVEREPRGLNFRLVNDPGASPADVRRSGMIVHTQVAPNAQLGIGLFTMGSKKSATSDARLDGRRQYSRRAGVSFRLKF